MDRWAILATAIAGQPVRIVETDGAGGAGPGVLWLPPFLDVGTSVEQNERAYLLRVALGASAIGAGLLPTRTLTAAERATFTALSMQDTLAALCEALPGAVDALLEWAHFDPAPSARPSVLRDGVRSLGASMPSVTVAERTDVAVEMTGRAGWARESPSHPLFGLFDGAPTPANPQVEADPSTLPRGTELRVRSVEKAVLRTLGEEREESPLVHSFEKLHTLEEHRGGRKRADGSDELEDHAEALAEVELTEVIRSSERAESLIRSDAFVESSAGDLADAEPPEGIPYDEWDERAGRFRAGWCRVHVGRVPSRTPMRVAMASTETALLRLADTVASTRRALTRLERERRARVGQLDGTDVDDDALVTRHAALVAGATPTERLYVQRRRHSPAVAVLLLIDASLSTDAWVDGRRVLDVERDAALVTGEALDGLIDDLAVATFSSRTRRECRFDVLKALDEPWRRARHRLFDLTPDGYTRVGPALRHGARVLEGAGRARKIVLLLTDGKPNDFDRYEGSHGLADVHHAVLEASVAGVQVHGLAIDASARGNLPRMFGAGGFTTISDASTLPTAIAQVVARVSR